MLVSHSLHKLIKLSSFTDPGEMSDDEVTAVSELMDEQTENLFIDLSEIQQELPASISPLDTDQTEGDGTGNSQGSVGRY